MTRVEEPGALLAMSSELHIKGWRAHRLIPRVYTLHLRVAVSSAAMHVSRRFTDIIDGALAYSARRCMSEMSTSQWNVTVGIGVLNRLCMSQVTGASGGTESTPDCDAPSLPVWRLNVRSAHCSSASGPGSVVIAKCLVVRYTHNRQLAKRDFASSTKTRTYSLHFKMPPKVGSTAWVGWLYCRLT